MSGSLPGSKECPKCENKLKGNSFDKTLWCFWCREMFVETERGIVPLIAHVPLHKEAEKAA